MNLDLKFYTKLFWRRLPVMFIFILASATLGVITAMKLPETWSSSARLLVEAPQIPSELVSSMVEIDAVEQLDIIEQKLLTRANLVDIANELNVFEDMREMSPDDVVAQMRDATRIRRTAGRNRATVMTIHFEARTSRIAAAVVNEYVTLVLEENADIRVTRAENTLAFFEQEVQRLDRELSRQSAQIAAFRSDNLEALPEDQTYRQGRQTLLQDRVGRLERDLAAAVAQREDLQRIFAAQGSIQSATEQAIRRSPAEQSLAEAQAALNQALTVFSETHPRIRQLETQVEQLRSAVVAERAEQAGEDADGRVSAATAEQAIFQATLSEIEGRIDLLSADLETSQAELGRLQAAIARSSNIGIELASLNRDYENIQARYNVAVNNLNSARVSERIETTAQGQRITVIENANVPRIPSGPNRRQIAIVGTAFGIMMAVGYFLLLEVLNRNVRRPAELVSRFGVTPITTIPYMESWREKMLRRTGILAATAIVLVAVPLGLWYIDTNYLPLELVVQKGLEQLGLG